MVEADKQQRKIMFQKALDGVDDDLFMWLAHQFYVQSKIRLLQMPWDHEHPASIYAGKKISNSEIYSILSEVPSIPDEPEDVPVKSKKTKYASVFKPVDEKTKHPIGIWDVLGLDKPVKKKKPLVAPLALDYEQTLQALNTFFGAKLSKWVDVIDAPVLKKKAYNSVAGHLAKGTYILYTKPGIAPTKMYCGKVKSCGQHFAKVEKILGKNEVIEAMVGYENVKYIGIE